VEAGGWREVSGETADAAAVDGGAREAVEAYGIGGDGQCTGGLHFGDGGGGGG
jgi:hypothetical protein